MKSLSDSQERDTRYSFLQGQRRRSSLVSNVARAALLATTAMAAAAACGAEGSKELSGGAKDGRDGRPGADAPRVDGGPPKADGGADAGSGQADAGTDAGSGRADAGEVSPDAGTGGERDAGEDAGQEVNPLDSLPPCAQGAFINEQTGLPFDTDFDGIYDECELEGCVQIPQGPENPPRDEDRDGICAEADPDDTRSGGLDSDNDGKLDQADKCHGHVDGTDADDDGSAMPCDCNDNDPSVHPGATDSACDGIDKNCDEEGLLVTENPNGTVVIEGEPGCECRPGETRPIGQCARRGTETCMAIGQNSTGFEITDPAQLPELEVADGVDNDCDTIVDEGFPCNPNNPATQNAPCGTGTDEGECKIGTTSCMENGEYAPCTGNVEPADSDPCNGKDDDCDGVTDNAYGIYDGSGVLRTCRGVGACAAQAGVKECRDQTHAGCSVDSEGSATLAGEEICNGTDDDCNGRTDEVDFSGAGKVGTACALLGNCGAGVAACAGDRATGCNSDLLRSNLPGLLEGTSGPFCDGQDSDCDGMTDDGCPCSEGETQVCGSNVGPCRPGVQTCNTAGQWSACGGPNYLAPQAEVADGVDNNCDGIIPEGALGDVCRGGVGACNVPGVKEANPAGGLQCSTGIGGNDARNTPELCNGIDDDCDGSTDERDVANGEAPFGGFGAIGLTCDPAAGSICGQGFRVCDANDPSKMSTTCSTLSRARTETCDGRDEDCNGVIDNGCATECDIGDRPVTCGRDVGECTAGTRTCQSNGTLAPCVGAVNSTAGELCGDNKDSDCDGADSNGFNLGAACLGRGACPDGFVECNPLDRTKTQCSTGPDGSNDQSAIELCNGIDDDCDGVTDENIPSPAGKTLGLPGEACTEPGICGDDVIECNGLLGKRCRSIRLQVLETCDGSDQDCDGTTDDGFIYRDFDGTVRNPGESCTIPVSTLPSPCDGSGVVVCTTNGTATQCSTIRNAQTEVPGNGIDENCNKSDTN